MRKFLVGSWIASGWGLVTRKTKPWLEASNFFSSISHPSRKGRKDLDWIALEKEMATHSSVLAWRIPGTGEPGGLPSMGSHSRTRLKQLSSSSSSNDISCLYSDSIKIPKVWNSQSFKIGEQIQVPWRWCTLTPWAQKSPVCLYLAIYLLTSSLPWWLPWWLRW